LVSGSGALVATPAGLVATGSGVTGSGSGSGLGSGSVAAGPTAAVAGQTVTQQQQQQAKAAKELAIRMNANAARLDKKNSEKIFQIKQNQQRKDDLDKAFAAVTPAAQQQQGIDEKEIRRSLVEKMKNSYFLLDELTKINDNTYNGHPVVKFTRSNDSLTGEYVGDLVSIVPKKFAVVSIDGEEKAINIGFDDYRITKYLKKGGKSMRNKKRVGHRTHKNDKRLEKRLEKRYTKRYTKGYTKGHTKRHTKRRN